MAQVALPSFEELYAQIAALPQGVTGEILEPGVVRTMSRPARRHRRAGRALSKGLDGIDQNVGGTGWWIEIEAEIRFGLRLAVPDLAGWRAERVPELPDENPLTIPPDWCCEILSTSTARDDRRLKLPLYVGAGVGHVWLLDPSVRLLEVYVPGKDGLPTQLVTLADEERGIVPPFDVAIDLGSLWLPG